MTNPRPINFMRSSQPDFDRKGFGETRGYLRALQKHYRSPIGTPIFLALVYLVFSNLPGLHLPRISWVWYIWGMTFIYAVISSHLPFPRPEETIKPLPLFCWIIAFMILNPLAFSLLSVLGVQMENLNLPSLNLVKEGKSYIDESTKFTNPRSSEAVEKKGITFDYFKPDNSYYLEGEPLSLSAKITVDGLSDPQSGTYESFPLSFACYQQELDGSRGTAGEIHINDDRNALIEPLQVEPQALNTYIVTCLFKRGLTINSTRVKTGNVNLSEFSNKLPDLSGSQEFAEGIVIDNKLISNKIIVLEAEARFSQVGLLKIYMVADENKPLNFPQGIDDPDLNSDGHVQPRCVSGCGQPFLLSLTTGIQPVTEMKQPRLDATLLKNTARLGALTSIESLVLSLPDGLSLSTEAPLPCAFNGAALSKQNLDVANKKTEQTLAAFRRDHEYEQPPLSFTCYYTISQPPEALTAKLLQARVIYNSLVYRRTTVQISRDLDPLSGGQLS